MQSTSKSWRNALATIALLAGSGAAVAASGGTQVVQLPNGDGPNGTIDRRSIEIAVGLAICSHVDDPERQTSPGSAERCLINANLAIRIGQIADVPALALALRQIPFTNAAGNDNVAQMSDLLATTIEQPIRDYTAAARRFLAESETNPNAEQPANVFRTNYSNADATPSNPFPPLPRPRPALPDSINHAPFTGPEIDAVIATSSFRPSAAQLPNREIPIDTAMAYLATAADAVIHPMRYTQGAPIAQTIADARTRTPAALDREIAIACFEGDRSANLSNGGVADLLNCRLAAARNSLEMIANGEAAPYNPARYGIPVRINQR